MSMLVIVGVDFFSFVLFKLEMMTASKAPVTDFERKINKSICKPSLSGIRIICIQDLTASLCMLCNGNPESSADYLYSCKRY